MDKMGLCCWVGLDLAFVYLNSGRSSLGMYSNKTATVSQKKTKKLGLTSSKYQLKWGLPVAS